MQSTVSYRAKKSWPISAQRRYGALQQVMEDLSLPWLHAKGYRGQGVMIAVLDAGFPAVDRHPAFGSGKKTWLDETWHRDFVQDNSDVFQADGHGTEVLSLLAADRAGMLVGSAPDAAYVLIRTEDVRSETLLEEFLWVRALEYADSLGVDIVHSSLGYHRFDYANMDHAAHQLDGRQLHISRAAGIACTKGMAIVVSAGNAGRDGIDAPADGLALLAVGATNKKGQRAKFSAIGPTADGRVKPDIAMRGVKLRVASHRSGFTMRSGTSYSAPLISGLVASLWQAYPKARSMDIMNAIRQSGSRSSNPDYEIGFGIPDAKRAFRYLDQFYSNEAKGLDD